MTRVYFSMRANPAGLEIPAYAVLSDDEDPRFDCGRAVADAIARKNSLDTITAIRDAGRDPVRPCYATTIGRVSEWGATPVGEIEFAIDRIAGRE